MNHFRPTAPLTERPRDRAEAARVRSSTTVLPGGRPPGGLR